MIAAQGLGGRNLYANVNIFGIAIFILGKMYNFNNLHLNPFALRYFLREYQRLYGKSS